VILLFHTVRYLKCIQIRHQLWHRLKYYLRSGYDFNLNSPALYQPGFLQFNKWIDKPKSLDDAGFTFLNLSKSFNDSEIDWGFLQYGKLWNYNLHYMDYLLQPDMGKERGLQLIHEFLQNLTPKSTALEPYPISVRGINWIKFLNRYGIHDPKINHSLFMQYNRLVDNLEYHLLGNHLLENGFSLLFGACYLNDQRLYIKAKTILKTELEEQVLADGGHFERSTMYHQIVLDRLLDNINLLQNNEKFNDQSDLLDLMLTKGSLMLQWLNAMTFSNGLIPMVNDSAPEVAPSTKELNQYAVRLGITSETAIDEINQHTKLSESGYRRFNGSAHECIIDVGSIGPDYQPGHAHADTFSFTLCHLSKPVIVDTGISTYEKNNRRQLERSTCSHNTVQVRSNDSSEVWGGFRVARRAKIIFLQENSTKITARHDGYKHLGIIHERTFENADNCLIITDANTGSQKDLLVARIHLHPDIRFQLINNTISTEGLKIEFQGHQVIGLSEYRYAAQYNTLIPSKVVEITFHNQLKTIITIS
jgi:hypothetical protein